MRYHKVNFLPTTTLNYLTVILAIMFVLNKEVIIAFYKHYY